MVACTNHLCWTLLSGDGQASIRINKIFQFSNWNGYAYVLAACCQRHQWRFGAGACLRVVSNCLRLWCDARWNLLSIQDFIDIAFLVQCGVRPIDICIMEELRNSCMGLVAYLVDHKSCNIDITGQESWHYVLELWLNAWTSYNMMTSHICAVQNELTFSEWMKLVWCDFH